MVRRERFLWGRTSMTLPLSFLASSRRSSQEVDSRRLNQMKSLDLGIGKELWSVRDHLTPENPKTPDSLFQKVYKQHPITLALSPPLNTDESVIPNKPS